MLWERLYMFLGVHSDGLGVALDGLGMDLDGLEGD